MKAAVRAWEALVSPILECKRTSNAVVRGELGWHRLEARRDLARLRFLGKIVLMSEDRLVKRVYRVRKAAVDQAVTRRIGAYRPNKVLLEQLGLGVSRLEPLDLPSQSSHQRLRKTVEARGGRKPED